MISPSASAYDRLARPTFSLLETIFTSDDAVREAALIEAITLLPSVQSETAIELHNVSDIVALWLYSTHDFIAYMHPD